MQRRTLVLTLTLGSLVFAACGSDSNSAVTTTAAPATTAAPGTTAAAQTAAECAKGKTLTADVLTIATGNPAYPPYVLDDKPESGQGFEAALALAVAKDMGFEGAAVKWVRTDFDSAVAGTADTFDFNLQQFTINADREKVVSFSTPYYTANQAVLGYATGAGASVKSLADLKKLKLGAAAGTTSLQFITDIIKPDVEPFAFNSNADAKTALDNKQIDAIVTDLPTALYISAVEISGTKVFGQIPASAGGAGDSWGLLFKKDNPLAECANLALADLTKSGDLGKITQQWMADYTEAPELSVG